MGLVLTHNVGVFNVIFNYVPFTMIAGEQYSAVT